MWMWHRFSCPFIMFTNYLSLAFRQLRRGRLYGGIKIGGFALSIAACLLITLYLCHELSYDRSYPDAARLYRVVGYFDDKGLVGKWTAFPAPMAGVIRKDFPQVERSGRLMYNRLFTGAGANEVRPEGRTENTYEEGFTYADPDLLNMLELPVVDGPRENALAAPHTIVLTRSKAEKLFPGQDAVGKNLFLNDDVHPYRITAVIRDLPTTTHLVFSYFLSTTGIEWWKGEQDDWGANNYMDYVQLRPGTDVAGLEKRLTVDIRDNYYLPSMTRQGDKNAAQELKAFSLHLQPIGDVHLRSAGIDDGLSHGDIRFVWLFGIIAGFILVIACINFVNLSTAKAANRAKEVGVRKVIGAGRGGLVFQFLVESVLYSGLSFVLGLLLAWLALPLFNRLADRSLAIPWNSVWLAPVMLGSALVIGVVAGLYPAFYLSAFRPVRVLKGNGGYRTVRTRRNEGRRFLEVQRQRGGTYLLRDGLVVFQFTASIILMIATAVIYGQMHYMLSRPLGYDKEQVVLLRGTNTIGDRVWELKRELLQLPQVRHVSVGDFLPVAGSKRNGNSLWEAGRMNLGRGVDAQSWAVDTDYLATMGMQLVAGRNFLPADSTAAIINQALAADLHFDNPLGKRITNGGGWVLTVVGVVRNFNFESLRDTVAPLQLYLGRSTSVVSVKLSSGDVAGSMAALGAVWRRFAPDQPLRATFLDEDFARMYADVQRMAGIFTAFALLAISIACLGLFALAAFMAEQRSKEIGIRKVLGASVAGITALMSRDFVRLVVIAFLIASPLAWWGMSAWLRDFANRIPIGWWMFALAGGAALVIALCTVGWQSIRAARANPVRSLRSE
jgi:putative ABC transport system permease protein